MSECCVYFIFQIQKNGIWIDTDIKSKDLKELNKSVSNYLATRGYVVNRIIQRRVEDDRNKGRVVPRCC